MLVIISRVVSETIAKENMTHKVTEQRAEHQSTEVQKRQNERERIEKVGQIENNTKGEIYT